MSWKCTVTQPKQYRCITETVKCKYALKHYSCDNKFLTCMDLCEWGQNITRVLRVIKPFWEIDSDRKVVWTFIFVYFNFKQS